MDIPLNFHLLELQTNRKARTLFLAAPNRPITTQTDQLYARTSTFSPRTQETGIPMKYGQNTRPKFEKN
ncbi:hypothetical protein LguiB_026848 [Lonicera macranthoides]